MSEIPNTKIRQAHSIPSFRHGGAKATGLSLGGEDGSRLGPAFPLPSIPCPELLNANLAGACLVFNFSKPYWTISSHSCGILSHGCFPQDNKFLHKKGLILLRIEHRCYWI